MKLLLCVALLGCATPHPVPDVFSAAAHEGPSETYQPLDAELWTFSYQPELQVDYPPYLRAPDENSFSPGAPYYSAPDTSEAPWR